VKACIEQYTPDLMGTQEGLYAQLKDLAADLPAHAWVETGRDGGSRGEFMAVFCRKERFEPLEYDHFWLSDTPDVIGSSTWGNTNRRMVTWVRCRDLASGREFHFRVPVGTFYALPNSEGLGAEVARGPARFCPIRTPQ
jgi:hypothetical protein